MFLFHFFFTFSRNGNLFFLKKKSEETNFLESPNFGGFKKNWKEMPRAERRFLLYYCSSIAICLQFFMKFLILWPQSMGHIYANNKAASASRLVKSPDSHASDTYSRLGGSSWLCYGIYFISEFNEMREFLLAPSCVKSGKLAVPGRTLWQSTWPCSIYEDILQSSTKSSVVRPSTVGKIGSH